MLTVHVGSAQHTFVIKDLASVNRTLTPWLVVGGHRPFYIDSTNNMEPDGDQPVARALREAFEEVFYTHQVRMWAAAYMHMSAHMQSAPVAVCLLHHM